MPGYTPNSNIPYPLGNEPIRGTLADNIRVDLEELAQGADAADVVAVGMAVGQAAEAVAPRLAFAETLAAIPGSRKQNYVIDPSPLDPVNNYTGTNVSLSATPGTPQWWGRATATDAAVPSVSPKTGGLSGIGVEVAPGNPIAASMQLRPMPDTEMRATMIVRGYTASGGSLGAGTTILTTGQQDLPVGKVVDFAVSGTVPDGYTHVVLSFTFRGVGETFPTIGDFCSFRRTMLTVGSDPGNPPSSKYFDGNSPNSYWLGEPGASQSVTATPRTEGSGGSSMHDVLVSDFTFRRGGIKPIGDITSVSFRIDHGLKNFNSKMRPKLDALGFKYVLALGSRDWGHSENAGITPATVNGWVTSGGAEVYAHGPSHADTSDEEVLRDYIVNSKAELEADIPAAAPIDGFAHPGASGAGGYGGFTPAFAPSNFDTFAGRLVLDTYAIATGHFPGSAYRVQDGVPRIGQSYYNMEAQTASAILYRVQNAITDGRGIQLMIHPSYIDQPGYITTAELASALDQIKTLQDEGKVVVMSAYDQYLADSTSRSPFRLDTDGVPYF